MEYLKGLEIKFNELLLKLKDELASIRTNRPTAKLVEDVKVDYSEQILTIKQLGSIGVEPPRNLVITPWSQESAPLIVKAIEAANLGIGAVVQGNIVRVTLPELTQERRQELVKIVRNTAEQIRIRMRVERDEINKKINQESDKDDQFRAKEKLQKLVDSFNSQVDSVVETKLNEIFS